MELEEMYQQYAFIDESGNPDLDVEKEGASGFFFQTAVVVRAERLEHATSQMRQISKDHFGGKEVKSSGVRGKHKRRLKVLDRISEIDFGIISIFVDKKKSQDHKGLHYKRSFYKYFSRKIHEILLSGTGSV